MTNRFAALRAAATSIVAGAAAKKPKPGCDGDAPDNCDNEEEMEGADAEQDAATAEADAGGAEAADSGTDADADAEADDAAAGDGKVKNKAGAEAATTASAARAAIVAECNARFAAVMSSPEAAGRTDLAVSLLTKSDMSAETIISTLAKAPTAAAAAAKAGLQEQENPDLGTGTADADTNPASAWDKAHARAFPNSNRR